MRNSAQIHRNSLSIPSTRSGRAPRGHRPEGRHVRAQRVLARVVEGRAPRVQRHGRRRLRRQARLQRGGREGAAVAARLLLRVRRDHARRRRRGRRLPPRGVPRRQHLDLPARAPQDAVQIPLRQLPVRLAVVPVRARVLQPDGVGGGPRGGATRPSPAAPSARTARRRSSTSPGSAAPSSITASRSRPTSCSSTRRRTTRTREPTSR